MKIIKTKSYKEMSNEVSKILLKEISKKSDLTICLATGKTLLGLYKLLVINYKNKKIDFSKIKIFNLDEYYPIKKTDKKSFNYFLHKNFLDKVNVDKENIFLLNGESKKSEEECKNYEKKIKKNPIDILILGVGVNGHIGFNEPGSLKESKTRLVKLTPETKKINKTIKKALTIGISTIMKSKKIILLASGKKKAKAIKYLIKDKENKTWPVTYLKNHENLIAVVDKEAGRSFG